MRPCFVVVVALAVVAGHAAAAVAQEQGTPPLTVVPVPTVTTPATDAPAADPPPTTGQEPLSPADTSPVEDTRPPTTGTSGAEVQPDGRGYLWWFVALVAAGISSIVYGWMVTRRAGASGGYEALGVVQESGSHGPDSIFMMRNGPFDDVEGAVESANSASILWNPTNDERHLWWIIRSVQTGDVVEIIGPLGARGEEGQCRAKPPQLIVDLTEKAPTRAP